MVVAQKLSAATTVAATMICADLAGIRIFATGGIGGVHRGAATTFDISADLQELAHTNVAVVSAGAKAILDLRLTLEYLETVGVPVIGFQTDELPAFYSRESGIPIPQRIDSETGIAEMLKAKWDLGLKGGALICNPIPEKYSLPRAKIDAVIDAALREAKENGVTGKDVTPFLLGRIAALSGGESLESNIELVKNNARLAGVLAVAFHKIHCEKADGA